MILLPLSTQDRSDANAKPNARLKVSHRLDAIVPFPVPSPTAIIRRLRTLALVGMHAARVWDNHDLLHRCVKAERDAHWWHVLTSLGIPFDVWQ